MPLSWRTTHARHQAQPHPQAPDQGSTRESLRSLDGPGKNNALVWFRSRTNFERRDGCAGRGRFRVIFRTIDGEEHDVSGVYREVVSNQKLAFSWNWASPREPKSLVTIDLEPDGDGTLLTLTHEQIADDTVHDYHRGWIGALGKLEKLFA